MAICIILLLVQVTKLLLVYLILGMFYYFIPTPRNLQELPWRHLVAQANRTTTDISVLLTGLTGGAIYILYINGRHVKATTSS